MGAGPEFTADPRYPIGKFRLPVSVSEAEREGHIETIEGMPARLRQALGGLSAEQLDTPYRDGGWTVRQVAHHVPDSHMNAFIRMKLALTEDEPTIKPYDEAAWAKLGDVAATPVETSLVLLEKLHERWVGLMRGLSGEEWKRAFRHPEMGLVRLDAIAALCAWHGEHHTAHVTSLLRRRGW